MTGREDEARRLAEERGERRAAKDFAAADELRDRIRGLGFEVIDTPAGFELQATATAARASALRRPPEAVVSILDHPPDADWTIHWLAEGWPADVLRGIASFRRNQRGRADGSWPDEVEVIPLVEGLGWARSRNAGLGRTRGRLVAVVDGSIEAAGDVLGPLEGTLADRSVGITGPMGAVTDDLREFRAADGHECDAVEGYLMAFPRELLQRGLAFDPRFRFYRAADLDFSFQVKALDLRAVVTEVPIERHEHRAWSTTPEADRERLSKRNFYRFLDRWRGRTDLLVSGS